MNFIFISPNFPSTYYRFAQALRKNGVTVLGIGDAPYDQLATEVKNLLNEYYYVHDLKNYSEKYDAVKYFLQKYGKIDFIESNNEYWLDDDARLRTDFNITTGPQLDQIPSFRHKSEMKKFYALAGVKSARGEIVTTLENAKLFIKNVGYPVVTKPDDGMGASKTMCIHNDEELEKFFKTKDEHIYFMEEFVEGELISYDGVCNSRCEVVYPTHHVFPIQVMDIVNNAKECVYYTNPIIPDDLDKAGRSIIKTFNAKSRFFHLEFFRLTKAKKGLGKKGDLIGLEVNMRVPGGYTPDLINYAYSIDIYQIWADVIAFDENRQEQRFKKQYACYVGRRNYVRYKNYYEAIVEKYKNHLVLNQGMPDVLSDAMGNYFFMAKFTNKEDMDEFIEFLTKKI